MSITGPCNKSISCNVCQNRVDGLAFRTVCYHLLCPRCAQESFQGGNKCPICSCVLEQRDVSEMTLGMECSNDLVEAIYQNLFERTNWSNICESHEKLISATAYVSTFLFTQLTLEVRKEEEDKNSHRRKAEILQEELVSAFKYFVN